MRNLNRVLLAIAVMFVSIFCAASSIPDPGGIIRNGDGYSFYGIINPDFTITFGTETVSSFNPYDPSLAEFCPVMTVNGHTGPDCQFENQSGVVLGSVSQLFSDFVDGLTCENQISNECSVVGGDLLNFFGFSIPSTSDWVDSGADFNILYFDIPDSARNIQSSFNAPEPAGLTLLLTMLGLLGLTLRRKMLSPN